MYQIFSSVYSLSSINQALISHPVFSETLIELFHAKFTPKSKKAARLSAIISHTENLQKYIKNVKQIIDDQILRRLCSIVTACVRTNVHIKELGEPLSFKFNCSDIFAMPTPVPYRETFVFDQARRGSYSVWANCSRRITIFNRLDDYRTGTLGRLNPQIKNAVIIPVGAKVVCD